MSAQRTLISVNTPAVTQWAHMYALVLLATPFPAMASAV